MPPMHTSDLPPWRSSRSAISAPPFHSERRAAARSSSALHSSWTNTSSRACAPRPRRNEPGDRTRRPTRRSHLPPPTAHRLAVRLSPNSLNRKHPFSPSGPPLSSTGWPRPKKGAPKAALPAANGTSTRPNRLTRKPKRAFIVPIHRTAHQDTARWFLRRGREIDRHGTGAP
jgi:hypothetical protein